MWVYYKDHLFKKIFPEKNSSVCKTSTEIDYCPHTPNQRKKPKKGAIIVKVLQVGKPVRTAYLLPRRSHVLTVTDNFPQILPSSSCFIKPPHRQVFRKFPFVKTADCQQQRNCQRSRNSQTGVRTFSQQCCILTVRSYM